MPRKTKIKYNIEEIKMVYEYLNSKEKELINLYYFHNLTLVNIAKKFGVSEPVISKKLKRIHEKINNILTNKDYSNSKKEILPPSQIKTIRNYTKEEILSIIDNFEGKSKTIIALYYGLNDKYYSLYEIANILDVTFQAIQKRLKILNRKIEAHLMGNPENNIHKKFKKEQIELVIDYLIGQDKEIYTYFYGLNSKELKVNIIYYQKS